MGVHVFVRPASLVKCFFFARAQSSLFVPEARGAALETVGGRHSELGFGSCSKCGMRQRGVLDVVDFGEKDDTTVLLNGALTHKCP